MNGKFRSMLSLSAAVVEKPWGGSRLWPFFGKPEQLSHDSIGEVWLVSTVGEDVRHSRILSGNEAGRTLRDLISSDPGLTLGVDFVEIGKHGDFPLLFKWIDARHDLSVQVHPDDALAQEMGIGETGKEETWLIIDSEPGATVRAGFTEGWSLARLLEAVSAGADIEDALHRFPVGPGDLVHVPPGTVHSIGSGILLAEIQQPSDITFRIHDGETLGADGQPRELHLNEAARIESAGMPLVLRSDGFVENVWEKRISATSYEITDLRGSWEGPVPLPSDRCSILTCLAGRAEISCEDGPSAEILQPGEVRLVLPGEGEITLETLEKGWFAIFAPVLGPS